MKDICQYGSLPADDPRSLHCDYSGFYPTHWCQGSWSPDVQAALESASSVTELRLAWDLLEQDYRVDTYGGGEWHHALAHLRYKLANG
jgi:hypothetical protein